jgi:MFS family permease
VAPLLGIINEDIGPDPNYVWIALCYILTLAIGQVLVGRLSDIFGRRWFCISGSVLALLGCIISAVATNIPMLIGGTVLVGLASVSQLSYVFVLGPVWNEFSPWLLATKYQ